MSLIDIRMARQRDLTDRLVILEQQAPTRYTSNRTTEQQLFALYMAVELGLAAKDLLFVRYLYLKGRIAG